MGTKRLDEIRQMDVVSLARLLALVEACGIPGYGGGGNYHEDSVRVGMWMDWLSLEAKE